jgi:hypothetical protein
MSRFTDYDDDDEFSALNYGRWQRNMRVAVTGRRGQAALRALREALMALPEHKLIDSAVCTVGGLDKRAPAMTDAEFEQEVAKAAGWMAQGADLGPDWPLKQAEFTRRDREEQREQLAEIIFSNGGEGVCAVGAFVWHQKVKAGMDPAEAFASLPTVFGEDGEDPATETAELGQQAGLTYTLAWMLAQRNDDTYKAMTPEQRWQAFVDWIDERLTGSAAA